MRSWLLIFGLSTLLLSCGSQNSTKENNQEIAPQKNDDGEWDLTVLDGQYDYFLSAVAKPIDMYSETFLKTRNAQLVSEWNNSFYSGRYRNIIESSIQYDLNENYGKNFEYKLYQVFVYVNWKYGFRMNGISETDRMRR